MSLKSKRKGKAGELELAGLLTEELGVAVCRNLTQARAGGCDLIGVAGWSIEVKRANQARLNDWWTQAVEQARSEGSRPALAYRLDRQPWRFRVALADLLPNFKGQPLTLDWTAELSLSAFAALVRESIEHSPRTLLEAV